MDSLERGMTSAPEAKISDAPDASGDGAPSAEEPRATHADAHDRGIPEMRSRLA